MSPKQVSAFLGVWFKLTLSVLGSLNEIELKSQLHKSSFSVHGTFKYVLYIRFSFKHLKLKSGCGPSELCKSALFKQVKLLNTCQSDLKRLNLHVFSLC